MPDNLTLGDLHYAIQAAMGWSNSHLHAFRVGAVRYANRSQDEMENMHMEDEASVTLASIRSR